MRKTSGIARLTAVVVGTSALVMHLFYSLGSGGAAVGNFFSYFTMQSAIVAVVLWFIGGVSAFRFASDPRWLVEGRLLATTYQLVSGAVYTVIVLQAVAQGISIQVPISSQVLHYWMPAFALLDWLVASGRPRISWNSLAIVLVFPLAWGGFTMIRGAAVGWYPYFFLDPYQVDGPAQFALYSAIVLAFIVAVAAALMFVSRVVPQPPLESASRRSVHGKRLEAQSSPSNDLVIAQLGESSRTVAANETHQNR